MSVSKRPQGFAAMDPARQRELASKGGKASHAQGTAHQWTSVEASIAGRKGGKNRHRREVRTVSFPEGDYKLRIRHEEKTTWITPDKPVPIPNDAVYNLAISRRSTDEAVEYFRKDIMKSRREGR